MCVCLSVCVSEARLASGRACLSIPVHRGLVEWSAFARLCCFGSLRSIAAALASLESSPTLRRWQSWISAVITPPLHIESLKVGLGRGDCYSSVRHWEPESAAGNLERERQEPVQRRDSGSLSCPHCIRWSRSVQSSFMPRFPRTRGPRLRELWHWGWWEPPPAQLLHRLLDLIVLDLCVASVPRASTPRNLAEAAPERHWVTWSCSRKSLRQPGFQGRGIRPEGHVIAQITGDSLWYFKWKNFPGQEDGSMLHRISSHDFYISPCPWVLWNDSQNTEKIENGGVCWLCSRGVALSALHKSGTVLSTVRQNNTGFVVQVCLKYYEHEFVELACQCPAVVCCRCSPTQKAHIVTLLQQHTGRRTCAIGESRPPYSRGGLQRNPQADIDGQSLFHL